MHTSPHLSESETMRCVTQSGINVGLHLAALERQRFAQSSAEQHIAVRAAAGEATTRRSRAWALSSTRNRASRWLGDKLITFGHRLAEPVAQ